ncbi:MAG: DUF429 domain-containing protein [Nannocystaceae bacterium]|nr:DUF429 domain-containing protein [Nannocystaceae bacterium]
MRTVIGIDAATQPKKIGLARGTLDGHDLVIEEALLGSEAESVLESIASWISGPTLLAIDAPLGWPAPLGRGLYEHRAGQPLVAEANHLFRRETDRFVHATLGKLPLEVGADRIARTAHSALGLLGNLRQRTGLAIPLAWSPALTETLAVEVYPAASLLSRGLSHKGYKGKEESAVAARRGLVEALSSELDLRVDPERLVDSDDRLDAVVCVLAGVDFLHEKCVEPDSAQREDAGVEGWIWFTRPASANER